jgi:hypothetical protein
MLLSRALSLVERGKFRTRRRLALLYVADFGLDDSALDN